ncbi:MULTISPECIES: hypothetical protein [unclassified Prochlorococcus]|uniref:hypothetical protein n=1 Tax=unclassified Prochlorococcus TaxID=2627481 RepID=UPI0005337936|nr:MULTISPECIES: hypothetical protein [unclassified Prochlorococcus]KGG17161.1 putative S1 RNA binding domain-containing protein [Prochlorococcus sp. MIT 0603]
MKRFFTLLLILIISFSFAKPAIAKQDIEAKVIKLENKISKKFSKTFCNSTGFGISNEGALKFSLGETNSEFVKNPLIEKVDIEKIKNQIMVDIADTCYYFELDNDDLVGLSLGKAH